MSTTETTRLKAGEFCWADLNSTDLDESRKFYGELLGWSFQEIDMGGGHRYTMVSKGEVTIGGMNRMAPEQKESGMQSLWNSYVLVEDVAAKVEQATTLGATILVPLVEAGDFGTMAYLADPTGATIALWKDKQGGSSSPDGVGTFCWNELLTGDTSGAEEFYRGLFDWSSEAMDIGGTDYTVFNNHEKPAAGMMALPQGQRAPHWLVYISVGDCEKTVVDALGLRATIVMPPTDFPGVGRGAILTDSTGAAFGVIQLAN